MYVKFKLNGLFGYAHFNKKSRSKFTST